MWTCYGGLVGSQLRPQCGHLSLSIRLILIYVSGGPRVLGAAGEQTALSLFGATFANVPVTKATHMVKPRFRGWNSHLGEKSYQETLQRGLHVEIEESVAFLVIYMYIHMYKICITYTYTFFKQNLYYSV